MRKLWPGLLATAGVAAFGFVNLARLPEQMATHWNAAGQPDGFSSRTVAVLLLPALGIVIALVLSFLPRIDPLRANFPLYEEAWWFVGNVILIFMAGLQLFVTGNALGWQVPMDRVVGFGVGALLVALGAAMPRVKQNWFLGIRTPWTLSSQKSWRETHLIGGCLFILGGLLLIGVTAFTGRMPGWAIGTAVGVPAVLSFVYSYFAWRDDPDARDRPPSSSP